MPNGENNPDRLRKSQEWLLQSYRAAFEQSRDTIMTLVEDGFRNCNPATLTMFRVPDVATFATLHPGDLSPPFQPDGRPSLEAAGAHIHEALRAGQAFFEWRHRTWDGVEFPAEVLLSRIDLADGPILQAVVRDITERRDYVQSLQIERDRAQAAHQAIESSIAYARFLQNALLPDADALARWGAHAVVWWPRDAVGGDIYVARATNDGVLAGVIDCTGHGVPGAFMSMAAYAAFDHAVKDVGAASPAGVLHAMDAYVRRLLARETVTGMDDGLEIGLLCWDEASRHALFAGAGIDLYVVNPAAAAAESGGAGALRRVRGSKAGLGYRRRHGTARFTDQAVALGGGRCLYMFSDGLMDQVGGEDGRPFGRKRLEDVLISASVASVADQRDHIVRSLSAWQGNEPQRDDVTMLALRPKGARSAPSG